MISWLGSVHYMYVIRTSYRDELKQYLEIQGIQCGIHYPIPIHLQPVSRSLGYKRGAFPECEQQAGRILSLPIHQHLLAAAVVLRQERKE